ncbi:MAG: DUF2141 domain-containing protein [Saprospiraceae bacterium]|nr:DUF2141 domain-containing protein [Saprospiraceae bacterium]
MIRLFQKSRPALPDNPPLSSSHTFLNIRQKSFAFGLLILTLPILYSFTNLNEEEIGRLIIKINNVSKDRGIIWIGLYDSADTYLIKEKSILKKIDVSQKGYHEIVVDSLPYGTYAMALFHDVNANGEMDRNLLGIPSEPYAFSKKPKSKWRLPKFDEVKFDFSQDVQEIDTKLKKWWD